MVFLFINYLQTCSLFMLSLFMHIKNRIGIVMVSVFVSSVCSSSDWVRPNTMKLAFVVSPLELQHSGERAQTGWFGNRIMCPAVWGFYQDFLDRGLLLSRKLPNQGFLLVKLKLSPRKFYGHHHDLVDRYGIYVSQMNTDMFYLSQILPGAFVIHGFVTGLTRRVPLVELEMLTLPEHLRSLPVFSGVCVTRSLVLCVCFVDRCFTFCTFSFGHCVVCSSSIYGFWLSLWYLQTLLTVSWRYNIPTKRVGLAQSRHHCHFIECTLSRPWYSWNKIIIWL